MLSATFNALVIGLKPREKEVVSGRFGLKDNERKTLAEIGEQYGITRERVRQIEAEALEKLEEDARKEKIMNEISEKLVGHLAAAGGLRRHDLFLNEARLLLNDSDLHGWHLMLLAELFDKPKYEDDDCDLHPVWYLEKEKLSLAKRFAIHLEKLIKAKKDELVSLNAFADYLNKAILSHEISEFVGRNYVAASKRFATSPFGDIGLADWEEIVPRTMGSKAYVVMKKHGKPLHFRDIAEHINRVGFDERKALPQTIHNELIKDSRFVLVGRGIYGLREHGYAPGTTREVIRGILKNSGPLEMKDIIDTVLKKRFLERNTILLNLQNRKHFKRLPDGRYYLK